MSARSLNFLPWRDIGLSIAGLVAGGITVLLADGVLPPLVVLGLFVAVALFTDRRGW